MEDLLEECFAPILPERLMGDKAYDSDPLDKRLAPRDIELIASTGAIGERSAPRMGES